MDTPLLNDQQTPDTTGPKTVSSVLFTSIDHLERFYKMLPQWQELRASGVRFASDFPHMVEQRGWGSRRKIPLPILGLADLTLTNRNLTLHATQIPPQRHIRTLAFKLIEQSKTTQFVNLDEQLSRMIAWKDVTDIRWHVAKSHKAIGDFPASSSYVLIEFGRGESDSACLCLQVAPKLDNEPVDMAASKLDAYLEQNRSLALAETESLFHHVETFWAAHGAGSSAPVIGSSEDGSEHID